MNKFPFKKRFKIKLISIYGFFLKLVICVIQVNLSSVPEQKALALQHRALDLLTDTQPAFVDALISIYQLKSLDPSILRLHIMNLQDVKNYKEVSFRTQKQTFESPITSAMIVNHWFSFFLVGCNPQHEVGSTGRTKYGKGGVNIKWLYGLCLL